MKRIIGLVVLTAALCTGALAIAGDSMARKQACPSSCAPGSGSCPMSCAAAR
jgi:hypothetical protein